MGEICIICAKECRGGFEVYERQLADGTPEIVIDSTPDRNFNVCNACSRTICFACSIRPDSGYCNECYLKYGE